ncbi:MAG: hypothetical protein WBA74_09110 [Cyclobacteriaceae bacterium]
MKKFLQIVFLLMVLHGGKALCQTSDSTMANGLNEGLYIGLKVGLPYLIGVDMGYLIADRKRVRVYLNASVQTIILFNSANIGGGYFLGKKGFSLGLRFNNYAHIVSSSISDEDSGKLLGPELAWFGAVGKSKTTIISFQLGTAGLNFSLGARVF